MKVCILMGSPRLNGNTAELCKPFIDELKNNNAEVEYITLHNKNIKPCMGCNYCQDIKDDYGCVQKDDMQIIVQSILNADIVVFASPVYTWSVTAPMKAVLDRMYGINKYYGKENYGSLYKGQSFALIATSGYVPENGPDLINELLRRLCEHSSIKYLGMHAVQDIYGLKSFNSIEAQAGSRKFAKKIIGG